MATAIESGSVNKVTAVRSSDVTAGKGSALLASARKVHEGRGETAHTFTASSFASRTVTTDRSVPRFA